MNICVWYVVDAEAEYLIPSISVMSSYEWVKYIVVLHTNGYESMSYHDIGRGKTISIVGQFGSGLDKSIENGGFDEVLARNKAIEFAETTKCDWLLQCDADEFYIENTIQIIENVENCKNDSINIDCVHLISLTQAYFHIGNPRDAHRRAWKPNRGIKYIINQDIQDRHNRKETGYDNVTIHSIPSGYKRLGEAHGDYHFHCHHLFGQKKYNGDWIESESIKLRGVDSKLIPKIYHSIVEREK